MICSSMLVDDRASRCSGLRLKVCSRPLERLPTDPLTTNGAGDNNCSDAGDNNYSDAGDNSQGWRRGQSRHATADTNEP